MTQASLRPPSNLQPRPKATPTFSSFSTGALSRSTTPQLSRPSSQSRNSSPVLSPTPTDDPNRAAATLVRRVLCSNSHNSADKERPVNELLPPLTSNNDVDLQLYALVAIIVKDLVQTWYGKITTDQSFVDEVVKITAHCTRALEGRIRRIDLEALVFDEIPGLIDNHINAFRISYPAAQSQDSSTAARVTYHNLNSHPALEPIPDPDNATSIEEQARHEASYRQLLAQGALAILLPTEDLENACLRTLVADVIAEPVLGNSLGGKVCESWFIWANITKIIEVFKSKISPTCAGREVESDTRSRLEQYGLLAEARPASAPPRGGSRSSFSSAIWGVIQLASLAFTCLRFVVFGLLTGPRGPLRSSVALRSRSGADALSPNKPRSDLSEKPRPLVDFRFFSLSSNLLDLSHRMPWLWGILALLRHHLSQGVLRTVGGTDGLIDQAIHNLLTTSLDPSVILSHLLSQARQSIFPHNTVPSTSNPAPVPPPEQVQRIKRECAESIISLLPPWLCGQLLGGEGPDDWAREVELELDVWGDEWMNRHLGYKILEVVMVRVLPELGEKTVKELMEGRLGGSGGGGDGARDDS